MVRKRREPDRAISQISPSVKARFCGVEKVIVSMGVGEGTQAKTAIEAAARDLMAITGQKPKTCRARVSISEFKLVKGTPIGLKVTLRNKKMEAFLQKLFRIVLPSLRDFQGLSTKSFDGRGNYNLGITEQIVFSEIDASKIDKIRGLQVTIVTNTGSDQKAKKLLEKLGMPFSASRRIRINPLLNRKKLALTTKGRKSG